MTLHDPYASATPSQRLAAAERQMRHARIAADIAIPSDCCPTCGEKLREQFKWDRERRVFVGSGKAIRFTKTQAKLIDAIWRKRGGVESIDQFMSLVYGDREDGGPENPSVISVHLANIRRRLKAIGYTVTLNEGRPRRGFCIIKIGAHV